MMTWLWCIVVLVLLYGSSSSSSPAGAVGPDVIERMAQAIMEFEGWAPGSRSERNHNPGNLKLAGQPGAVGRDSENHAIFDSFASGWAALVRQLTAAVENTSRVYTSEMTLREFFSHYAEANSAEYAVYVAGRLGVPPNIQLKDLA